MEVKVKVKKVMTLSGGGIEVLFANLVLAGFIITPLLCCKIIGNCFAVI